MYLIKKLLHKLGVHKFCASTWFPCQYPRFLSLVRFDYAGLPKEYHDGYPFNPQATYIFLGDIPNMMGHCVVMDSSDGKFFCMYHTDHFKEIPEDEV